MDTVWGVPGWGVHGLVGFSGQPSVHSPACCLVAVCRSRPQGTSQVVSIVPTRPRLGHLRWSRRCPP